MTAVERLADLLDRTQRAERAVRQLAQDAAGVKSHKRIQAYAPFRWFSALERIRLEGKAEGLRIACSYIREALQEAEQA